ncbi:hypothetical protein B4133_3364 [Bacillus altitudinis]|nr:hypothetical protein VP59_16415 [Bacillus pumilus]KIL27894.1 hypothetical protein B4133_3364 [Bacillus altitudinis]
MKNFPIAIFALTLGAFSIGMTEFVIMGLLPNVANDLHVSISALGQLINCSGESVRRIKSKRGITTIIESIS